MRYGSVCSGIEAATAAWHGLGWTPVFYSEIEAFPRAVLNVHYPNVPLHGDFTTIGADQYGPINLLVGGTPCQSFSIAGLRGGLDDDRGNLALEFLRLAQRTRPQWLVWENVPGVLSSGGGRDFGSILGGLVELGYGFAYRVLDAQYFGVAQRRRRVFVVGYLGDWRRAAAVLFERQSLCGNPAPSRQTGEEVTRGAGDCTGDNGFYGPDVSPSLNARDYKGPPADGTGDGAPLIPIIPKWPADVAPTMNAAFADKQGLENQHALNGAGMFVPSTPPIGFPTEMSATQSATAVDRSPTLSVAHTTSVAYSIMPMNSGKDYKGRLTDVAQPIMANGPVGGNQGGDFVAQTLGANSGGQHLEATYVPQNMAVRRLTPTECERLQGFPDGYTQIPYRNKTADNCPDGPRYKALGNSMAVPVMKWIGERIQMVEGL